MQSTVPESFQVMTRFLDVIIRQNEALRYQTTAFVDTIWEIRHLMSNFDDISRNIKDVHTLSFHLNKLLSEVKAQMSSPECGSRQKHSFAAKQPAQTGFLTNSNPVPKPTDQQPKTVTLKIEEDKFTCNAKPNSKHAIADGATKTPHEYKAVKIYSDFLVSPKSIKNGVLPLKSISQEKDAHSDFDFFPLKEESRRIFEDNPDHKSLKSFDAPIIEPSIFDENTYFKKDDLYLLRSKEMSKHMSNFDGYSFQTSRSSNRLFDFDFCENKKDNFGQNIKNSNFSDSISNHDLLFKRAHSESHS
jgi:hypothetical protein